LRSRLYVTLAASVLVAFFSIWTLSRSRTFQLFGEIVPRVETERKVVALTFDDGPVANTVDEILAPLAKHGVKATFFVCGAEMERDPQVAAKLVAAGHELGNHSYSHKRMVFKSPSFIRSEFERTDALIRAAGHRGPIHVRAPYCKKLVGLPWYFARNERVHVTFDVEPESEPELDADMNLLVADVVQSVRPGSIVLLHPWYRGRERSRAAVPLIIERLQREGYELVTVNELLTRG
jgi:peptidoglycan/xylan/chitin deacetylase (PgdA/CDA1 family)